MVYKYQDVFKDEKVKNSLIESIGHTQTNYKFIPACDGKIDVAQITLIIYKMWC